MISLILLSGCADKQVTKKFNDTIASYRITPVIPMDNRKNVLGDVYRYIDRPNNFYDTDEQNSLGIAFKIDINESKVIETKAAFFEMQLNQKQANKFGISISPLVTFGNQKDTNATVELHFDDVIAKELHQVDIYNEIVDDNGTLKEKYQKLIDKFPTIAKDRKTILNTMGLDPYDTQKIFTREYFYLRIPYKVYYAKKVKAIYDFGSNISSEVNASIPLDKVLNMSSQIKTLIIEDTSLKASNKKVNVYAGKISIDQNFSEPYRVGYNSLLLQVSKDYQVYDFEER